MLVITTCRSYPQPPESLLKLIPELRGRGVSARFDCWQNRPDSPFLLPLCAWDYAAEPQRFRRWLQQAQSSGSRFVNPPELMLWNMNKHYLCDLAAAGADVIPTETAAPDAGAVTRIMQRHGWHEAVLKPAVGQSGKYVVRIRSSSEIRDWLPYREGVIVQPFIADIETAGETALIFFNGRFSHAVHRRPPAGEWRANSAYGVRILPAEPPPFAVTSAARVLASLPQMPVYARVDGTLLPERFLLNELELIEPALYLDTRPEAVAHFADVLAAVCLNAGTA